jgi:hypothetical protein
MSAGNIPEDSLRQQPSQCLILQALANIWEGSVKLSAVLKFDIPKEIGKLPKI